VPYAIRGSSRPAKAGRIVSGIVSESR
jgi:hypothetical protein